MGAIHNPIETLRRARHGELMSEIKPIPVTKADVAFGGKAMQILPAYQSIPDEFKRGQDPWVKWQQEWFFSGLKQMPTPKPGVDLGLAMANLACCQGSFEPKHEHKEAGVAYLASLWFEAA